MKEVLAKIKPSKEELQTEINFANKLIDHIRMHVPDKCEVVLTGSVAKKTFLKNKKDVDIFILFSIDTPRESLQPIIRSIMDKAFPTLGYQLSYAEHPYVRFHISGRKVDLVPAYKILNASERVSAVDRSILHTKFIMKNLKEKQRDEVLLLKQFLKANSLYGAEIKIKGFSGYLCELLIVHYGSFKKLLQASKDWDRVFIDIKKYHKKKTDAFGDFAVIDPTDKDRNVAAALSAQNISIFRKLARAYLKKPDRKYFFKPPESFEKKISRLGRERKKLLLSLPRPDVVDDILWGQLYKLVKQLEAQLRDYEPRIIADDSRHMVRIAFLLKRDRLPPTMLVEGPPLSMKTHLAKFKKAHKDTVTKKGKIYARVKRPVTKAADAIMEYMRKFSATDSHLACQEELIILEKL